MNKKTINKILQKKHQAFVATIKDASVRKLVEKNTMISGGAIASMLLNEEVNDYDYYFTDLPTTLAVAKYFVGVFIEQHPLSKIKPKVEVVDGRVNIFIESAGIVGESENDIKKLFETRPEDESTPPSPPEVQPNTYHPVYITSNAITLSDQVQLILRFYGEPKEVHANFDFVHCMNYWVSESNQLVLSPLALEALLAKQLIYQGSLYPVCSVIRTRKFINRGWTINAGQYLKMCFQISELDLMDLEVLRDQLIGVDSTYFQRVIELCMKKIDFDPKFNLTTSYLVEVIDRIF